MTTEMPSPAQGSCRVHVMNAAHLRELQAPLKARYKESPASALVTLTARGRVSQTDVTCVLESSQGLTTAGLHRAAGGDGTAACSAVMLLEARVGCAGVTFAAVSTAMGIELGAATVVASGDLDFRGTLGVSKDAPVGFTSIDVTFTVDAVAPPEKLEKLVQLTERYCVVFQTLAKPPTVVVKLAEPSA